MYTDKERRRAVEMVTERGMSCREAARRLNGPGHQTVSQWVRQAAAAAPPDAARDTFEDRRTAVEHYLSHGRSLARTVRELGYPTRPVLASWVDELAPGMRRARRAAAGGTVRYDRGNGRDGAKETAMARTGERDGRTREPDVDELARQVGELAEQVRLLRMQCAVVEEVGRLLGKGRGGGPETLTNREKATVAEKLRGTWPLRDLLAALCLARRTFFHQIRAMRHDKYRGLRERIRGVFEDSGGTYGYRRVRDGLLGAGVRVAEGVVRRLMREEGLVPSCARAAIRGYSSYRGEIGRAPENILDRDFTADKPGVKLVTDITEFRIPAGKVYLSPMIDCFDGMPVAWSIGERPDAGLVNAMLDMAVERVGAGGGVVVHSDRGAHYRWPGWVERMDGAGWTRSMSRKGCSPDNAAAEGFFGNLKMEFFHGRDWRGVTVGEFMGRLDAYLRWYCERRVKHRLGGMSPVEWRRSLGLVV